MSIGSHIAEWLRLFRTWSSMSRPYTPDSQAVSQTLGKIDAMKAQLGSTPAHATRIGQIDATLTALKTPQEGQTIADLPMKHGALDTDEWDKKSQPEQRNTWTTLDDLHKELRCLNAAALKCGTWCFVIVSGLLLLMVSAYLCLHRADVRTSRYTPLTPTQSIGILQDAHFLELQLAALKEARNRTPEAPAASSQSTPGNPDQSHKKPAPPAQTTGTIQPHGQADTTTRPAHPSIKTRFEDLTKSLDSISLPYETIQLLGTASAELEAEDITIHLTYQEFLKHLRADVESLNTIYFWTIPPWRWLELSLWATMGCLVGLLFYIAGLLKQGLFQPEDIPMFGAEVLMAPIVVPVVFFLFNLSSISEFAPSQSSITMNIGVAFVLGFAIRRTIGILDLIKKRILPDPSPGSGNPRT